MSSARTFRFALIISAFALLASAAPVRAQYEIEISTDGGNSYTTYTTSSSSYNANTGVFTILESNRTKLKIGLSSTIGATSSSFDVSVAHNGNESYSSVIILASVNNVTTIPPQSLTYTYTGSGAPNVTMQTWGSADNQFFDGPTIVDTDPQQLTGNPYSNTGTVNFSSAPSSAYSITEKITIQGLTVSQPDSISLDGNNDILPSPVPGGLTLVLTGLLGLALFAGVRWSRIRRQSLVWSCV